MKNCFRFVIISLTFALFQQPALINAEPERSFNNELDRIIENVGENLVTVKGLGAFRNFIATGTGIDTLGHILTSSSVCDVADFEIIYSDGKSYKGRKIGVDKQSGLCILEIDGPKIRPVSWKIPTNLKPESWVAAPGLRYGQISGINFGTYLGQTDEGLLTLSIEVNPGSFGGIVLDSDGVPIGILVARESNFAFPGGAKSALSGSPNQQARIDKDKGRAYALTFDIVNDIVFQLLNYGEVRRGFMGVGIRRLTNEEMKASNTGIGVFVNDVLKDSPAERAGIIKGDVIIALDKSKAESKSAVYKIIRLHRPGDKISIDLIRDGKNIRLYATLDKADNSLFMESWKFKNQKPAMELSPNLASNAKEKIESEINRLSNELGKLKQNLEDLKDQSPQ